MNCATFCFTFLLASSISVFADSLQTLEDLKDRIVFAKRLILTNLPPDQLTTAKRIEVRAINSANSGIVWARREGDKYIVELSTGFFEQVFHIVGAIRGLPPGLALKYIDYTIQEGRANGVRIAKGQTPILVKGIFEWAKLSQSYEQAFFNDTSNRVWDDRAVLGTVAFALAHEYAHHMLGHVKKAPTSLDESRKHEAEADAWASEVMLRA